ncbi:MAG: hypothetical protein IT444_13015 [Phycisphaeraceae bacterium]|nr:hypothetical protein [Phycisphaeraceae bacterium]
MPDVKLDIPFSLSNPWEFPIHGMPLRVSVPLPRGAVRDPAKELVLLDQEGRDVQAQWRVLSKWKDGSACFALMDYSAATIAPRTQLNFKLARRLGELPKAPIQSVIKVKEDSKSISIDTGPLRWVFSKGRFSLAEEIHFAGRDWIGGQESDATVLDTAGQIYRASQGEYRITVEEQGLHRAVVLIEGDFRNPMQRFMNYKARITFVAGGSQVHLSHTIRNREPGRQGRDVLRWGISGGLAVSDKAIRRLMHNQRGQMTIYAAVEVPENVDLDTGVYETHLRHGPSLREDMNDVCYSIKSELELSRYGSCDALIDLHEPGVGGMLFSWAMPAPTYEGPMHLGSDRNRFEIDFYYDVLCDIPGQPPEAKPKPSGPMHLNEGMGKTRDFLINFHDDALPMRELVHDSTHVSYPGVVGVPAEIYRQAEFADIHLTLPQQLNKYPMLESKIDTLLAAQWAYDWPKASGWRDYGDEIGARGRCPEFGVKQFINNEEDYLFCLMTDAWRTGRPYHSQSRAVARHLMDIDYIDFSTDPGRDGADCPHSTGHTNGECYTSHQWCQGLLYWYLATGDNEALRISKRIGDNLIWWITGPHKSALTASGRESAWPMLSLAALYEVTGEEKYRDAGMLIVKDLLESHRRHGQIMWEYPLGSGIFSSYMALMTFNGIWAMYDVTGDATVLDLWKKASGPYVEQLSDPRHWGYLHFRNWPIKWADLGTLMRWYYLTGDKKYVELGRNGLRLIMAGCPQPLNQTQGFIAMGYRHFIYFLKLADEFGMIDDDKCVLVW